MTEHWHGTLNGYNNHRCRCPRCRHAQKLHQRDYRERLRQTPFEDIPHRTVNGYTNYGCRCDACRAAMARDRPRRSKVAA